MKKLIIVTCFTSTAEECYLTYPRIIDFSSTTHVLLIKTVIITLTWSHLLNQRSAAFANFISLTASNFGLMA